MLKQDLLMVEPSDSVLRAITQDGAFRVIVARTTETVRGVCLAQAAGSEVAVHLSNLVTGSILVRETMAPSLRVQGILRGAEGKGNLVADSHPTGMTRGLVNLPTDGERLSIGKGALLQMMRTLPSGQIHQGVVEMPGSGSFSDVLMVYMQISEQVASIIAVAVTLKDGTPESAGGYIVQLLPEADDNALRAMTERLSTIESMEELLKSGDAEPARILDEILRDTPYAKLDENKLFYGCNCDHVRIMGALATLGREEISELMNEGKVLEITCEFCGKDYEIAPEQLRGLLEQS